MAHPDERSQTPKTTKWDVELERVRSNASVRLAWARGVGAFVTVLASGVPIYALATVGQAFAGKSTDVSVNVAVSVVVTLAISGLATITIILSYRKKLRKQSDELIRLRERIENLERMIEEREPAPEPKR